jgi:hypothetical protein
MSGQFMKKWGMTDQSTPAELAKRNTSVDITVGGEVVASFNPTPNAPKVTGAELKRAKKLQRKEARRRVMEKLFPPRRMAHPPQPLVAPEFSEGYYHKLIKGKDNVQSILGEGAAPTKPAERVVGKPHFTAYEYREDVSNPADPK